MSQAKQITRLYLECDPSPSDTNSMAFHDALCDMLDEGVAL